MKTSKLIDLHAHPLNLDIYGDEPAPDDLIQSIRAKGVLVPLAVKMDGTVVSGHRRWKAAAAAGLTSVPVVVVSFADELEEWEAIVEFNRQREKTFSQRMKETATLEVVERERAKARMLAGKATDPMGKCPQGTTGTSRDAVAEKAGLGSARTYARAKAVWDAAQAGDAEALDAVADLDAGKTTISAAYNETRKPRVIHNTGNNEWYTPAAIVAAARECMGGIDCDPASSEEANARVGAEVYYSAEDDGLQHPWAGRVWLNPPYATGLILPFCECLVTKYRAGEIKQACVLVNNGTETEWCQILLSSCAAVCFVRGRVRFVKESGVEGTPLQGQLIFYFGQPAGAARFHSCFADFGQVFEP